MAYDGKSKIRCKICDGEVWNRAQEETCRACWKVIRREQRWARWDANPSKIWSDNVGDLLDYFESRLPNLARDILPQVICPLSCYSVVYRVEKPWLDED